MAVFVRLQEIEHEIGAAGRFALRVTSPDVELRAIAGVAARVRVQFEIRAESDAEADALFERVQYQVTTLAGSLEVAEPKHGASSGLGSLVRIFGLGSARVDASIVAEVPAGATLTFDGVSADITATGFTGIQQYRTVSGDLVLHQIGGEIGVRGVSSDVSLRADAPLRLELNTVSGDISAFAPRFDDLRLVTVSGDIELEGQLGPGHVHRVETVSGDFRLGMVGGVTLEVRALSSDVHISLPHRSEGSRERRRYIIEGGEAELLFSSMSGDLSAGAARRVTLPPPEPPQPPVPPKPPSPPAATVAVAEQLEILRALERGDIDVDEAATRLGGGAPDA